MLPHDISGDGSVIVGELLLGATALIWDKQRGLRPLQEDLETRFGLVLPGWTLQMAGAITSDGTRIAGYAADPAGQRKAFLVILAESARMCYTDCNDDRLLTLSDFGCFQTKYALGDPYADCNSDTFLNLTDFGCFQTQFAVGCP